MTIYTARDLLTEPGYYPEEKRSNSKYKSVKTLATQVLWYQLFMRFDPDKLLIFAPPRTLGSMITHCIVEQSDAWAFNIQCQRLELRRKKVKHRNRPSINRLRNIQSVDGATLRNVCYEAITDTSTLPHGARDVVSSWGGYLVGRIEQLPKRGTSRRPLSGFITPSTTVKDALELVPWTEFKDLLQSRKWTGFDYHGGSCMNVIGTYHYFEKMPPCILTHNPLLTNLCGRTLTSFSYKTVFAHYVHFRRVITLITKLEALQYLALQLAPAADSGTLDDLELISKGSLRLRDCWMEVEKSYIEVIRVLLPRANETTMPNLKSFTSYDCTAGALKADLEALFSAQAKGWSKRGDILWVSDELEYAESPQASDDDAGS